jgi:aerobic-type carbon monoxide dehydrogenase small subunit (CoxS/CutS family)
VHTATGKQITTIEGLEQQGRLHPLQEAFLAVGALQCGYCTAGMIMSGVGLLQKKPHPTVAEILRAMEGNICRCGTYPRVIAAIQRAANTQEGAER